MGQECFGLPGGEAWTYADIDRLSGQFAALLANAGIEVGDRVVAQVDKSVGAVGLYLGALRMGAVFVPLNTAYTASELEFFLADAEPGVFVCRPGPDDALLRAARNAGVENVFAMGDDPQSGLWKEALECEPFNNICECAATDLACIVYTSGTTGRSKGAMISHGALVSNTVSLHRLWGFEDGDVLLHALPIFHIHGLFVALHTAMLNGSRIIFLPGFDAARVRELLQEATVLMGVPTFYTRLMTLDDFGEQDCKNIRLFISGSAPLTEQASEDWTRRTGHRILERYGMTEAGMITSNPLDGERIPGTVGYPLPDVELNVCDDSGSPLPYGEIGAIEIRGPNLFNGYWRLPEKTAEEVRSDGFFVTGDLGRMEEDGRLSIIGRSKDLIISGGFNIYPKEIESVLDDIEGVSESAVIGVPHADVGEGVVAVLVAESDPLEDPVIQAALNEHLARFKHPRRFYWVDELPRNAMGKVQKNVLARVYQDAYAV